MPLPVLGPSTVRDTAGSVMNFVGGDPWYNVTVVTIQNILAILIIMHLGLLQVDFRAKIMMPLKT